MYLTHDTHPRCISFLERFQAANWPRLYMLQDPACVEQTQGTRDYDKMFQIGVSAGILTKSFYIHAFITQSSPKKQLFSCLFVCFVCFCFVLFFFGLLMCPIQLSRIGLYPLSFLQVPCPTRAGGDSDRGSAWRSNFGSPWYAAQEENDCLKNQSRCSGDGKARRSTPKSSIHIY